MSLLAMLFWVMLGIGAILLAVYNKQFLALWGMKPQSELFVSPRWQRSAHLIEKLGRLLLLVMGGGFLLNGVGELVLPTAVVGFLSGTILLAAGLLLLLLAVTVLRSWKRGL